MIKRRGKFPKAKPKQVIDLYWRDQVIPFEELKDPILAQSNHDEDHSLNEDGIIVSTKHLNRFIHFDSETGILECEAGITLADILNWSVPKGWFLPVLPSTQFISVGAAIAKDVHGKNHHSSGSFGHHVLSVELLRSNGERYICTREDNADAFRATISGLGLTGIILSAKLQLKPLVSTYLETQYLPFESIDEFFKINNESEEKYEYTAAWLDTMAKGKNFGRGIFIRANHSDRKSLHTPKKSRLTIPFYLPEFILNRYTMKTINHFYFSHQRKKIGSHLVPFEKFFFALDNFQHLNRIYGKKGFLRYECILPADHALEIKEVLKAVVSFGSGFLSNLNTFGYAEGEGFFTFPIRGVTLGFDIPNQGKSTLDLFNHLDAIVMSFGGRVNLANDTHMTAETFKAYYPHWETFAAYVDPQFSSSFWRRVMNHEK